MEENIKRNSEVMMQLFETHGAQISGLTDVVKLHGLSLSDLSLTELSMPDQSRQPRRRPWAKGHLLYHGGAGAELAVGDEATSRRAEAKKATNPSGISVGSDPTVVIEVDTKIKAPVQTPDMPLKVSNGLEFEQVARRDIRSVYDIEFEGPGTPFSYVNLPNDLTSDLISRCLRLEFWPPAGMTLHRSEMVTAAYIFSSQKKSSHIDEVLFEDDHCDGSRESFLSLCPGQEVYGDMSARIPFTLSSPLIRTLVFDGRIRKP
ncbi:hypothetical protein PIB30_106925 [Stylosanthes scabra]|uniref:Uncharacterized protein n=1 Tax=Stylosanthes scabra TaxID=79078 RepID=A0ABU6YXV8_9FABA|nr:hypothetical protein [Stylosanthes scabra]